MVDPAARAPARPRPPEPTAAQLAAVARALAQTSAEVAALAPPVLAALVPALAQAEHETARDLARWLATVPDADARFTAQHYRAVLSQLGRALDTVAALAPALTGALARMRRAAGTLSADHLTRELAQYGQVFDGTPWRVPLDLAALLASGESLLIPRHRTAAARYAGQVADDLKRAFAVALVRGESVYQLTERLVRHGGPRGVVALRGVAGEPGAVTEVIAEGLFARYRHWGERLARTETQAAYNAQLDLGLRQAQRALPDLERRWDASLDLRVCPLCAELHGATAAIGGAFPGGYTDAPAHPNCRCRVGAWRAEWSEILRDSGAALPVLPGAHPAFPRLDPDALADATARAAPDAQGLPQLSPADQKVVRDQLRELLADYAPAFQRVPRPDAFEVRPRAAMRGTLGQFLPDGRIEVREDQFALAQRYAARVRAGRVAAATEPEEEALATLVHEALHQASAAFTPAMAGGAGAIEEAATELVARRAMREQLGAATRAVQRLAGGPPQRGRAYDDEIALVRDRTHAVLAAHAAATNVAPPTLVAVEDLLDDAAVEFKRYGGPRFRAPRELVAAFVGALDLPQEFDTPGVRVALINALVP